MKSYRSKNASVTQRFFLVLIMLAATTVVGNAQFFVEGSVGMDYGGAKTSLTGISNDVPSSILSFHFSPKLGYWLNDNIAIGVKGYFSGSTNKQKKVDPNNPYEVEFETKEHTSGFAVFSRYKMFGTEKLSFLLESSVFLERYTADGYKIEEYKSPEKILLAQSVSTFGIDAMPLITYDLSQKFSLSATAEFFSLSFFSQTNKIEEADVKQKVVRFRFGANTDIFRSLSGIRIGFIYKF